MQETESYEKLSMVYRQKTEGRMLKKIDVEMSITVFDNC